MSHLSLYCPPPQVEDDGPHVLSFAEYQGRMRKNRVLEVIARAKVEKDNRRCPNCSRVRVDPLELGDGVRNCNGAVVPGTATVVGFRCSACRHEWPVPHPA